jgi:membrane associated rhomboid family serine protease
MPNVPPVTRLLIIINVLVFLGQGLAPGVFWLFALWPLGGSAAASAAPGFLPWQLVTYSFLHAGLSHLLLNMLGLYMFGGELERVFGAKRFLHLYFAAVITAALTQLAVTYAAGSPPFPTVGASGGIFGLLLAYGLYFPHRVIMLLIPPVPMPAWLFVMVYAGIELFLGVTGTQEGVAHFAHLGGMLGAWLVVWNWRRARRTRR